MSEIINKEIAINQTVRTISHVTKTITKKRDQTKMKTITEQSEIEIAYDSTENHEGAYATGRCLPGQYEQENCQEWAEPCTIDGAPAKIYWIFENSECESEDAGDYHWDTEHVSKIEIDN